ncbi:MAG: hypothetical protein J6X34_08510, partial [Clostridia bacterium]|nr:hypothetical protein [Clostridia bacterium]
MRENRSKTAAHHKQYKSEPWSGGRRVRSTRDHFRGVHFKVEYKGSREQWENIPRYNALGNRLPEPGSED